MTTKNKATATTTTTYVPVDVLADKPRVMDHIYADAVVGGGAIRQNAINRILEEEGIEPDDIGIKYAVLLFIQANGIEILPASTSEQVAHEIPSDDAFCALFIRAKMQDHNDPAREAALLTFWSAYRPATIAQYSYFGICPSEWSEWDGVAYVCLAEALKRFRPERYSGHIRESFGAGFSMVLTQEILREKRKIVSPLHITGHGSNLMIKVKKWLSDHDYPTDGTMMIGDADIEQCAVDLGMDVATIKRILIQIAYCTCAGSLDTMIQDDEGSERPAYDPVAPNDTEEEAILHIAAKKLTAFVAEHLSALERTVLLSLPKLFFDAFIEEWGFVGQDDVRAAIIAQYGPLNDKEYLRRYRLIRRSAIRKVSRFMLLDLDAQNLFPTASVTITS